MKDSITIVGMDVHKNSISIALAETGDGREVRSYGAIGGTMAALDSFVKILIKKGVNPRFVYEAGPCGYEIYRHLTKKGFPCKVIWVSGLRRNDHDGRGGGALHDRG
jgi:transposase